MKNLTLATLFAGTFLGLTLFLSAQDENAEPKILEWQREFENLDPTTRQQVSQMLVNANALYRQKRVFEALNALHELEDVFANLPDLHNLKGACYVEFRDFARAREEFTRAGELSPDNPDILFNLAELSFVTHQWPAAERAFSNVLSLTPEANKTMARLVEFKLLLIKIKLGKEEEVKQLAAKYDHSDDSPFHYYAEAALAYREDDTDAAERWLRTAQRIFRNPETLTPWMDTLVEYGYIKSFYGGDLEAQGVPSP
jgi:tetratricopeptide (TPR) repeat protein